MRTLSIYYNPGKATARFYVSYSARMITDPDGVLRDLRAATEDVEYDTIVVRGTSGMMIGPILARELGKTLLIVRKEGEMRDSHSVGLPVMGELGKRWIFVDDFCSSGDTFRKVRDAVKRAGQDVCAQTGRSSFEPELVGFYEYNATMANNLGGFTPWNDSSDLFRNSMWDDCPYAVKERQDREEKRRKKNAELAANAVEGSVSFTEIATDDIGMLLEPVSAPGYCTLAGCACNELMTPTKAPAGSGAAPGELWLSNIATVDPAQVRMELKP